MDVSHTLYSDGKQAHQRTCVHVLRGSVCPSSTPPPAGPSSEVSLDSNLNVLVPYVRPEFTDIHKALMWRRLGIRSTLKRKSSSCGVCELGCDLEHQVSSYHRGPKYPKSLSASESPDSKTSEPVVKETTLQIFSSASSSDTTTGESQELEHLTEKQGESKTQTDAVKPSSECTAGLAEKDGDVAVPAEESEKEKALRLLYCSLCKVSVNSASQLQAHNSGSKHKTMLEAMSGDGAIKSFPRSGVKAKLAASSEPSTGLQNKTFHCEICDVHVNSETQLKQHISSRRHKDRAAGKPAKPKFSHYSTPQRQQSLTQVLQIPSKSPDQSKPLAACFVQHPLSVAAAAAMVSLSHYPGRPSYSANPAFLQAPSLTPTLVHPSPVRLCSTHTPLLFPHY
ncbi:zinc finger protein 385D-like isoform X1 [Synchiropus splendidus]|uniref:zinc finger protein 385D-like isoform X1 n=2 Tax=Synchiropus splendidus TaxID=270530 RepID=UPI00237D8839|nr:zinc finger protein 385D-like isoform X1 [Synchiropus splendidus]